MLGKLNTVFLWHMHQPFYRDPVAGKYILPWVRLHGIKGYTDMLAAVRGFPDVRVTFNFTPCLIRQLSDLTENGERDIYQELSYIPAEDLEPAQKTTILRHFFSANWETMVLCYPRYRDLLYRRGRRVAECDLGVIARKYTPQDFRDLQVWFNLTWFGWAAQETHPAIWQMKKKGRDFSETEKVRLLDLQVEVLKQLIPSYKSAWQSSQIEISTSPFYHPILPLLIDNYAARICQPQDPLPEKEFLRPADARQQLFAGRDYIAETFGQRPLGLWPSEGSVSPAVCELAGEAGFNWLATDEAVLMATLGKGSREEALYQSYLTQQNGPTVVFRDRFLSDAIGFRYARNTPRQAVDDFTGHLANIAKSRKAPSTNLAAIILDGENAWEYFPDGGHGFLEQLYGRMSRHSQLATRTVGGYISEHPAQTILPPLFPASWINGSFRIWIGDPVKNKAWDLLQQCGEVVDEETRNRARTKAGDKALSWLLAAEGSDWFWWYGEPNHSDFEAEFDQLFRANLIQIYTELDLPIPTDLLQPVFHEEIEEEIPLFPMTPVIDGRETTFYEWVGARMIRACDQSGSMFLTTGLLERIYFGLSESHLFLRLDPAEGFHHGNDNSLIIRFIGEGQPRLEIKKLPRRGKLQATWVDGNGQQPILDVAQEKVLEVALPFKLIPRVVNEVHFTIILMRRGIEVERWPRIGSYACPWPSAEYLTKNWVI